MDSFKNTASLIHKIMPVLIIIWILDKIEVTHNIVKFELYIMFSGEITLDKPDIRKRNSDILTTLKKIQVPKIP
jgi:hypothetical protein